MWLSDTSKRDAEIIIQTWPELEIGPVKNEENKNLVGIYSKGRKCSVLKELPSSGRKRDSDSGS